MYQPSTLCLTTQHEANTLNSYPHQIEKKKHTQVKLMAFESTAAAASQNPASAASKSFVIEEQILCQRGNPEAEWRQLVSNPREGGQSSQILCNPCCLPPRILAWTAKSLKTENVMFNQEASIDTWCNDTLSFNELRVVLKTMSLKSICISLI